MDHVLESEECNSTETCTPANREAEKILRNSLYLTFNAPQVDEYHRGIFLTHLQPIPSILGPAPRCRYSGTLFHASYASPPTTNTDTCTTTTSSPTSSLNSLSTFSSSTSNSTSSSPTTTTSSPPLSPSSPSPPKWHLDQRPVKDVSKSHSLVLLYRIGTLKSPTNALSPEQFNQIRKILESVPLGRENRERELGKLGEGEGNAMLGGYDCVIWTRDAVRRLWEAGFVDRGEGDVDTILRESRALAGPEDARTMVGVDFGGFRVFN